VNLDSTPSARENKKSKPILDFALEDLDDLEDDFRCALSTTQPRIDNLVESVTHKSKNHIEVYLAVCLVLLMLKLNKNRCAIVKAHVLFVHICS